MKQQKISENDQREIELAHLNLDWSSIDWDKLRNPLAGYYSTEHFVQILQLIRDPKNFYFTLKYILNLDVPPIHLVCLEELWNHAFPMLIAARGFGKTFLLAEYCLLRLLITQGCRIIITSASFRQAQFVMDYMETILSNAPIYKDITGTAGVKKKTDNYYLRVGDSLCRAIPLGDGCLNSLSQLTLGNTFTTMGQVFGDHSQEKETKIYDNKIWGNGNFNISDEKYYNGFTDTKKITTQRCYSLEGTYNHKVKVIRNGCIEWSRLDEITTEDYVLIDRSYRWHEGDFEATEDEAYMLGAMIGDGNWTNEYTLRFTTKDYEIIDYLNLANSGKDWTSCNDGVHFNINSKEVHKNWINKWQIKDLYHTIDKELPHTILSATRNLMTSCLRGLFDSDGGVQVKADPRGGACVSVSFWNTSETLVDQIRYILLHYGIISTKYERQRKNLNWNKEYSLVITGKNVRIFAEKIGFRLKRKQELLLSGLSIKSRDFSVDDAIPGVIDKMIQIASLYQNNTVGSKLVTASKLRSFKQANIRLVKLFIERYKDCDKEFISQLEILSNENIYYDKIKFIENSSCETYDIHIPNLHEYCASGFYSHNTKIRGYRANYILAEEFGSISQQIFEEVISGFAASASSPIENMKRMAQIEKLKEKGLWNDAVAEQMGAAHKPNQIIISGTATWDFKPFAKYWRDYRDIIRSRGDAKKLHAVMGDKWSKDLDWKDYTIIRIPLEIIPKGMMDDKNIARSKGGSTVGISDNEYHCFAGEVEVITDCGIKQIKDIVIGDKVLTHRNRFRKVEKIGSRNYEGFIYYIESEGNNQPIIVTPEHPFYLGSNQWDKVFNLEYLTQSNLKELSNKEEIYLSDYTKDYLHTIVDDVDYIYPPYSNRSDLSDRHIKYKTCVKNKIKLDYYFGIILGYYASEGSTSGATSFALDGHVTEPLIIYVEELVEAIIKVFDKKPKIYQEGNVARVVLHSVIITKFIKTICPGISDTKTIDPNILYSNQELMRGFLRSYWRGDGTVSKYKNNQTGMKAACTNKGLLTQVKACMSYFGIRTNLVNSRNAGEGLFQNKVIKIKPLYTLFIPKFYHEKFFNLVGDNFHYVKSSIEHFHYKIENIKSIQYDDLVYNLEVEEDNSYSLVNATVHNCIFSKDSNGFFPRKLIESCVCKEPILIGNEKVQFSARLYGDTAKRYLVMVDPASESDNFAIVVLELNDNYTCVVYCWTTSRQKAFKRFTDKDTNENSFYTYAARKIRTILKMFPCELVILEAGGGGIEVMSALHDLRRLEQGELPIWPIRKDHPIIWPGAKDWGYDAEAGLHMIEMVSMSKADYVIEANHALKRALENKTILFPYADAITLIESDINDELANREYDSLEDAVMEIEQLKEELATIMHTTTLNGRDQWITPEIILPGNKKGRMRKDRYSALVIGHFAAVRLMKLTTIHHQHIPAGGFINDYRDKSNNSNVLYSGPSWFTDCSNKSVMGVGVAPERPRNPFRIF